MLKIRFLLGLLAGLVIGIVIGAGVSSMPHRSVRLEPTRSVSVHRLAKDEWKAKAFAYFKPSGQYEGHGHMMSPTVLWGIDGDVFIEVMGAPDRTQTIGNNMYWYYACRDGTIQLVLNNRQGLDNILFGDVNDY